MDKQAVEMFEKTVMYQDNLIWVKPVCDFFNLHDKNQYRKIKNDPILGKMVGKNRPDFDKKKNLVGFLSTDLGAIDANGRILLTKKGFIRWIQIININTIEERLRPKFVQYQTLVFDYLYGSYQEEQDTRHHYTRLRKLERLYGKIGSEIKREKLKLGAMLDRRYVDQYQLNFEGETPDGKL